MFDHNHTNHGNPIWDSNSETTTALIMDTETSSGTSTPPLWRSSSPLHPSLRAEAIAQGQRELMEMVRNMPEAAYELSLKDIVEYHHHQHHQQQQKQEQEQEQSFDVDKPESLYNEERCIIPKKEIKRSDSSMRRGREMNSGGVLLKMGLPVTRRNSYRKRNPYSNSNAKPLMFDGGGRDKEWWKKRESEFGESESSDQFSNSNNGSSKSSGSDTSRSNSNNSTTNSRKGRSSGCWSFIFRRKARRQSK